MKPKYPAVFAVFFCATLTTAISFAEDIPYAVLATNSHISLDAKPVLKNIAELENKGVPIGSISFVSKDIFETAKPEENKSLFRLANRLHIKTRKSVIENQLLFEQGDDVSRQLIEETERNLRANQYLYDASISANENDDGTADLVVTTQDVWTLDFGLSAGRSGGKNKVGVALKEINLFGTGSSVKIKYKKNVDRTSTIFELRNNQIRATRYSGILGYSNNSDGKSYRAYFGRPYYALDVRTSAEIDLFGDDRVDRIYRLGEVIDEYQHDEDEYRIAHSWSSGLRDGWVRRIEAGLAHSKNTFSRTDLSTSTTSLPVDREFTYPFIGLTILEDKYATTSNQNQIGRTEDVFLGTRLSAQLGYAGGYTGSSASAVLGEFSASKGYGDTENLALLLSSSASGRWQDSTLVDMQASLSAEYFWRQSDRWLFVAKAQAAAGHNLSSDLLFQLGGETGLRGYPLRYQRGDRQWLVTLEQRLFTDWKPFQLVNVGGAVFFDAGSSFGGIDSDPNADLGVLKDVGIGLRLGNRRSGSARMIHADLALPLDGGNDIDSFQFLISTKKKF